jgi:aerobic carbon-monoxide dehydrogenase medium subunit|tara:strand:+ start:893 stop:1741 length:849 start_codon:yes stop_codon:yes gene_type:complete
MKAETTRYIRATDVSHAISLLAASKGVARLLAGGQSLVPSMNLRLTGEISLIDINGLSELSGIQDNGGTIRIGALTSHRDLTASELLQRKAPALSQAATLIAHAAIRTRGTIGGSLAYCDPAAELPACMLALDATIVVQGPLGERRVAAENFFVDVFTTDLAEDEIITTIEVPVAQLGEKQVILELARRSGDYALVGIVLTRQKENFRIAYFGVGSTAVLANAAMAALKEGKDIDEACATLVEDVNPENDMHASAAVRRHLAKVLLRRAYFATTTIGDAHNG